jgi:hypothetical protein
MNNNTYLTGGTQTVLTADGVDNPDGWNFLRNDLSSKNKETFPDLEREKLSDSDSYLLIEHSKAVGSIDTFVKSNLNSNVLKGFKIRNNSFCTNGNNKQLFGVMTLNNPEVDSTRLGAGHGLDYCIGYRNSLDKSLPMDLVFGSSVFVCSNLMFTGENKAVHKRKHTRGADFSRVEWERNFFLDMDDIMVGAIYEGLKTHHKNLATRDIWSNLYLKNNGAVEEIVGSFAMGTNGVEKYFKKSHLINSQQLTSLRKELGSPTHSEFGKNSVEGDNLLSLWSLYNCFTESLKRSRPNLIVRQFGNTHKFFTDFVDEKIQGDYFIKTERNEGDLFEWSEMENDLKSVKPVLTK